MTACCYAACGRETSDNANEGPQRSSGERKETLLVIEVSHVPCGAVERVEETHGKGRTCIK